MVADSLTKKEYHIGSYHLKYSQFCETLQLFPPFKDIPSANLIQGPFDGKINTIYRVRWPNSTSLIFRARISRAFRYEPIVKEKILYPLLDGTLDQETPNLREEINHILGQHSGTYMFSEEKKPIVPVQDLVYYFEPEPTRVPAKSSINWHRPPTNKQEFPYLCSIKNYLPGITLYDYLQSLDKINPNDPQTLSLFHQAGKNLAQLHTVQFSGFYDKITDIGKETAPVWSELFKTQWNANFNDAAQYHNFQDLIPGIEKFYRDNCSLVADEHEAVLFHNDYQSQNLILTPTAKGNTHYSISGIIDFDNWRIGPRAQDFIKMEYWTIQNNQEWLDAFYRGYAQVHPISSELKQQVRIYKLLWFMLVYAFEMDKIKKQEKSVAVDSRFPAAQRYITDMETLIRGYL